MLLCPECCDSQWFVEGSPYHQTVTCHGFRTERSRLTLCREVFTLPPGVIFFSTVHSDQESEIFPTDS